MEQGIKELLLLADAGLEMLFGEPGEYQNPFLKMVPFQGYPVIRSVLDQIGDPRSLLAGASTVPTIFLLKDGTKPFFWDGEGGFPEPPKLSDLFCYKTSSLLTPLPTPDIKSLLEKKRPK